MQLSAAQVTVEQRNGALVLDTRPAEQFVSIHIRGSIQIGLLGYFASWAAILIEPTQRIVLIAEDLQRAQETCKAEWRREGLELAKISVLQCEQIVRTLESGTPLQLIDVRSRAEWLKGHLPGAISVPLQDLNPNTNPLELSKPSLIYPISQIALWRQPGLVAGIALTLLAFPWGRKLACKCCRCRT
jgi:rhodanese-related sulfurtransferase